MHLVFCARCTTGDGVGAHCICARGRHLRNRSCHGRIYNPPLQGAVRRGRPLIDPRAASSRPYAPPSGVFVGAGFIPARAAKRKKSLPLVPKGRWYAKHTGGDQNCRSPPAYNPSGATRQLPFTGEPLMPLRPSKSRRHTAGRCGRRRICPPRPRSSGTFFQMPCGRGSRGWP